ncbi:fumarylacetoacetate hydrolase family protein [Roseiconus lacunae]|uniref:Fumarylacetoacetate hydrolase family protein n=1 Tax=Roseiconus lacunae TaxID=2605694 RepID=A0ABT7PGW7_9BACT|nr:fumarylacetoacetate hydrolase family protein [Roseiconus lacunae]MCD0458768.1 fumarylacetoacetate hydrolase family protein [Roseiconus lacunae]MDM4015748.1 fumarylacetoacetate hydrolase family protein [Roseiconus lacunae]
MPLCRIPKSDGTTQYAFYRDGNICPVDSIVDGPVTDENVFELATEIIGAGNAAADDSFQPAPAVLLPPTPTPEKIFCIGLNYRDHAIETGAEIPTEPVVFSKFNTALIGHGQTIELPAISTKVDYEAELVVVIGKEAKDVAAEQVMECVFGYACGHDVSARDWQKGRPGGQWLLGKTFDTFAPVGPCVTLRQELPDPSNLRVQMELNGEIVQDSTTAQLIFDIPTVVAHLSKFVTLKPGDLIFTGTPPGVGDAKDPPVYLKPGDRCSVIVEGIGTLTNQTTST